MHEYEASVHASVNAVRPMLQSAQQLASQLDPGFHIPSLDLPELRLTEVHLRALPSTREMRDWLLQAWSAPAAMYNRMELLMAIPLELLLILIATITKQAGGRRPIGFMNMLCRIWCRARRQYLVQWETLPPGSGTTPSGDPRL